MDKLGSAFIRAKRNMKPVMMKGYNPHFKSKYVELEDLLDAVEEALWSEGLDVWQYAIREEGQVVLKTRIVHVATDEYLEDTRIFPSYASGQEHGKDNTYMRRIGLMTILGRCGEEDDDGESRRVEPKTNKPVVVISKKSLDLIMNALIKHEDYKGMLANVLKYNGVSKLEELSEDRVNNVLKYLEIK